MSHFRSGWHFMFGFMSDYDEPSYFSSKSILLLITMAFLVYLVSPLNSMRRKEREGLLLVYPVIIFVYWLIFQARLLSLDPHVHFYLGQTGVYTWMTNSLICMSFGAAFSFAIIWSPGIGRRCFGSLFLALYALLIIEGIFPRLVPAMIRYLR